MPEPLLLGVDELAKHQIDGLGVPRCVIRGHPMTIALYPSPHGSGITVGLVVHRRSAARPRDLVFL
jgi:hypothetical protein